MSNAALLDSGVETDRAVELDHNFPVKLTPILNEITGGIEKLEGELPRHEGDRAKSQRIRAAITTLREVLDTTKRICPDQKF